MFTACLIIFQFCGLYPISIQDKENESVTSIVASYGSTLIHILLTLSHFLYMIIRQDKMLYSESVIGKINDILVYFSLVLAHLTIIVETFIERAYFKQFWYFYDKAVKLNRKSIKIKWYRGYLIKFILYICFTLRIEIAVISTVIDNDEQWANFWFSEIYSLLVTRIRHIQHVFFIDIIFFSLQGINQYMKCLSFWMRGVGGDKKFARKHFYIKMSRMKEQFKNLMEMIICVNKIFRWSQVLNIG
ncbi:hypothetical protein ACKWTF_006441 [Chironomus riparius]